MRDFWPIMTGCAVLGAVGTSVVSMATDIVMVMDDDGDYNIGGRKSSVEAGSIIKDQGR
jgi:hypothetical protein